MPASARGALWHNAAAVPAKNLNSFEAVELAALRQDLEPDTRGFEAGQQGMPPVDAVRDPHERPITDVLEQRIRASGATLAEWQNEARRNLAETSEGDPSGDMHAAIRSAEGQFESVVKTRRPELDDKRLETEKRRTDFAKFRKDHDLTRREPHYPDKSKSWLMVGVLMSLFVVESGANSAFLAKGNELGLIGGWVVSLGISALNILSSFLIFGPASRYLGHVSRWRRFIAGAGMAIYVGFAFMLNLGVAHYREVSGDLIGEAGVAVVQRMQDSPFGLNDAESWLLFGLGFLFSIIAFLEGRAFDDVYPEYGRRDRTTRRARLEYLNELESVNGELDEIREGSLDAVKRIAHRARQQPEERRRIADDWRRQITEFEQHAAHLQQVGEALIDEYRAANRTARPDGVVPVAHRTPWRLPIPATDRSELIGPDGDRSSEERLRQIDEEYRSATDRICARCETVKDSLTPATPSAPTDTGARPTALPMNPDQDTRSVAT